MRKIILIFSVLLVMLILSGNALCGKYHSPENGPRPNFKVVDSDDDTFIYYIDANKENFHQLDKGTFSYWSADYNIEKDQFLFTKIIIDTSKQMYLEDRLLSFDCKKGTIISDSSDSQNMSSEKEWYQFIPTSSFGKGLQYILEHVKE